MDGIYYNRHNLKNAIVWKGLNICAVNQSMKLLRWFTWAEWRDSKNSFNTNQENTVIEEREYSDFEW